MLQERLMQPNTLQRLWDKSLRLFGEEEAVRRFYHDVATETQRAGQALMAAAHQDGQAFIREVQELTVPTASPTPVYGVVDHVTRAKAVDVNFKAAFDVLDFTGTRASGFDVNVYNDNITFGAIEPGENIKIYAVTGSQSTVPFIKYGGGVAWSREWIEDEKFYLFDDANRQLLGAAMRAYSSLGYSIVENAAQSNVSYGGSAGDSEATRDAKTIWDAARVIIQNVEDQLPGANLDIPAASFVLLSPLESVQRNLTALAITPESTQVAGGPTVPKTNVTLVPTNRLTTTSRLGVLCLAGFESKWGDRQALQIRSEFAAVKDSEVVTGTWRANGAVGNANQIEVVPNS